MEDNIISIKKKYKNYVKYDILSHDFIDLDEDVIIDTCAKHVCFFKILICIYQKGDLSSVEEIKNFCDNVHIPCYNRMIKLLDMNEVEILSNDKQLHTITTACSYCGYYNFDSNSLCGKCKVMYYCSKECQVKDWQFHKKICGKGNETNINKLVNFIQSNAFNTTDIEFYIKSVASVEILHELYDVNYFTDGSKLQDNIYNKKITQQIKKEMIERKCVSCGLVDIGYNYKVDDKYYCSEKCISLENND